MLQNFISMIENIKKTITSHKFIKIDSLVFIIHYNNHTVWQFLQSINQLAINQLNNAAENNNQLTFNQSIKNPLKFSTGDHYCFKFKITLKKMVDFKIFLMIYLIELL